MNSLYAVAQKGLDKASPEEVREVAVSVWHQRFTPSFSELTDVEALRTAGYLVDFLSRFHCVEPARKQELQALVSSLKARLPMPPSAPESRHKVDRLAQEWGLSSDLKPFLKSITPYQTRQYTHQTRAVH